MSYESKVVEAHFTITKSEESACVAKIYEFDQYLAARGNGHAATVTRDMSFREAMRRFHWDIDGNDGYIALFIDYCDGHDKRDYDTDEQLLGLLAPFVKDNCHIVFKGEEGEYWRFQFEKGVLHKLDSEVVYESADASNVVALPDLSVKPSQKVGPKVTQPDAMFLVLSDGETYSGIEGSAVLVIKGEYYATDDCASINDAGDIPVDVIVKRIPVDDLIDCYDKVQTLRTTGVFTLDVKSKDDNQINIEALATLFEVAEGGEEMEVLENLVVRAKLMWRCESCGDVTYNDIHKCHNCGRNREATSENSEVPGK